jgi:hypothetical protein
MLRNGTRSTLWDFENWGLILDGKAWLRDVVVDSWLGAWRLVVKWPRYLASPHPALGRSFQNCFPTSFPPWTAASSSLTDSQRRYTMLSMLHASCVEEIPCIP